MRFDSVIQLADATIVEDELLNRKTKFTKRSVYANAFSISLRELETAGLDKIKPEFAFQINSVDYKNETTVFVNDEQFYVYRINVRGDKTVLYLSKRIPNSKEVSDGS